ncbi:MAG: sulfotransferase [Williamsia sp.]|nr:sulfotransferase [Williamsia sp.]
MNNNILVITGMHRSGTSLITQWLNKCGLPVGDRLLGALIGNAEGHFEDLDFVEFHTGVLESQGIAGNGLDDKAVHKIDEAASQKLQGMIADRNAHHAAWGWKDPRTCLFLSVYRNFLPQARYLIIVRDYGSVVNSLISRIYRSAEKKYMTRSAFSAWLWKNFRSKLRKKKLYRELTEKYLKVCIAYNEEILQHARQLPESQYRVVDYKVLTKSDKPVFSHLHDNWNFPLQYTPFNDVYKEKLLNAPVSLLPFVKDKSLLMKAAELEAKLRKLIPAEDLVKT